MEAKELKIQAPEGYEIDKENSTFECIKFKPIKKGITYKNNDKIMNIAEILRHCPKGTKLYSTIFGEVTLDKINTYEAHPIIVYR